MTLEEPERDCEPLAVKEALAVHEPEVQGEAVNVALGEADTVKDGEALTDGDGVPLGRRVVGSPMKTRCPMRAWLRSLWHSRGQSATQCRCRYVMVRERR